MAAADCDLRAKITAMADAALGAYAQATGKDRSEIARDIIQDWAERQILVAQYIFGAIDGLEAIPPEGRKAKPKREALSTSSRFAIYERDKGVCFYCGGAVDREGAWHIDHACPVSKGGTNDPSNLRLACQPCNLKKAARNIADFKVA